MWRKNQTSNIHFKKAKQEGFRSRSAYKLIEIINKFKIIKKNDNVLDLGCAPGGWLQVIKSYTNGWVGGIDLQTVQSIEGVHLLQANFLELLELKTINMPNVPATFNVIVSDMSPNSSGNHEVDHFNSIELNTAAYIFAQQYLSINGWFVCKVLDGIDLHNFTKTIRSTMSLKRFKPKSSLQESSEIYLICQKILYA